MKMKTNENKTGDMPSATLINSSDQNYIFKYTGM